LAAILRGEIYWADLDPVRGREQAGLRPVLVLSNDLFNRRSGTVIAMAITSQPQPAGFPLTLALPPGCLPRESWVKISQVRTISVERIGKRAGEVDQEDLAQIVSGLQELIS
jgi:mRNA interferase MazF